MARTRKSIAIKDDDEPQRSDARQKNNQIHKSLKDSALVSSDLVDLYLGLILQRSKSANGRHSKEEGASRQAEKFFNIHVLNSFFYAKLCREGHAGVHRWTASSKVDLASKDRVLVPIYLESAKHWVSVVINNAKHVIEYYDSLKPLSYETANSVIRRIQRYIEIEYGQDTQQHATWRGYISTGHPEQKSEVDCGIFMLAILEARSRRRSTDADDGELDVSTCSAAKQSWSFTQNDVPRLRASFKKQIATDLIS